MLSPNVATSNQQSNAVATQMNTWFGDAPSGKIQIGHSFSATSERTLSAHEHVFLEGDVQTHIYLVLEGVIGVYKLLSDGRRQIVAFHYPGDMIGLDNAGHFIDHAEALCSARIRCIPVDAVDNLITMEPGFGQAMLQLLATELAETRDQLLSLGRKSAMEKLATFLVRISRRNSRQNTDQLVLHVPMTRAEIADYLGLTVETVSRNFTKLKLAQVIRLSSNSEVQVVDLTALENIAEGSV